MDLVQTVRKEGSRGGRADFKWEDVKGDQHRENYLGHSLMAPVGRWQAKRDLSWYARSGAQPSADAARTEEIRKIKEAEADALAAALGYAVAPRNANAEPLGEREVKRVLEEASADVELGNGEERGKGVGFGGFSGVVGRTGLVVEEEEVLKGSGGAGGNRTLVEAADRDGKRGKRKRSRSRSQERRVRDRPRENGVERSDGKRRAISRSPERRHKRDGPGLRDEDHRSDRRRRRDNSRELRSRSHSRERREDRRQRSPEKIRIHGREDLNASRDHPGRRIRRDEERQHARRRNSRSPSRSRSRPRSPYRAERRPRRDERRDARPR